MTLPFIDLPAVHNEPDDHTLRCGGKVLKITENLPDHDVFSTYLSQPRPEDGVDLETTALYTAAHGLMGSRTVEIGKPMEYVFTTSTISMVNWAKNAGGAVFDWEVILETGTDFVAHRFYDA